MTEVVTAPNMTDEEFIAEYIRVAQESTIKAADDWANGLFEGETPVEFIARVAPLIGAQLKELGITAEVVVDDASVADAEAPTEA